jgi:hypothetical protein
MEVAVARGWQSVALIGASDLTEIAILCASERGINVTAVVDESITKAKVIGLPVVSTLNGLEQPCDGFIITGIQKAQALYEDVVQAKGAGRVLVPPMLSVAPKRRRGGR